MDEQLTHIEKIRGQLCYFEYIDEYIKMVNIVNVSMNSNLEQTGRNGENN